MKAVKTQNAPAAIGPYSQAIIANGLVYTSGQIPVDPCDGSVKETFSEQAEQAIKNLEAVLAAAGSSNEKVVKTTCFLKYMSDFPVFNEIYAKHFPSCPARSCVEVACLPKNVLVEIEAVAEAAFCDKA